MHLKKKKSYTSLIAHGVKKLNQRQLLTHVYKRVGIRTCKKTQAQSKINPCTIIPHCQQKLNKTNTCTIIPHCKKMLTVDISAITGAISYIFLKYNLHTPQVPIICEPKHMPTLSTQHSQFDN